MFRMLFVPAIAAMNRMNFVVKFVVIGVVLLLPFAYVTHLLKKETDKQIVFNQKERYGVDYITPGFRMLSHLQNCRIYSASVLAGQEGARKLLEGERKQTDALLPVIDAVQAKYVEAFRTEGGVDACGNRWREIRQAWIRIRERDFGTQEESFRSYTEICSLITDWILNYGANYSNLILDPDLDSYWLMDAFVAKLPRITENLSKACARNIALDVGDRGPLPMKDRMTLFGLLNDASITLDDLVQVNFKTAYEYNNAKSKTLQSRLDLPIRAATTHGREFIEAMTYIIESYGTRLETPIHGESGIRAALDSTYALYEKVGPELDSLIRDRVTAYERDRRWGLIASETATFLHVYLFIAFYLAIHASVAKVIRFTKRMIEGTREKFELDSRDELGQLADSYNTINQTLIETRELKAQLERRSDELQASENRFRTVANQAPVGIFMMDASGDCLFVNEKWTEMAHRSLGEAVGRGWIQAIHPDDRERVTAEWSQAARSARSYSTELRFGGRDQEPIWIAANAVPLRDGAGALTGFIGSATDVTERRKMDRLKNEFISTVSHELRTPLTSIRGSLGLLAGGVGGQVAPKAKSMLDIAQKNCERLVRLVNDILDVEKIESGKMVFNIKSVDLVPLIESSIEANRVYGQNLGVGLVFDTTLVRVQAAVDSDRLTQVLTNLISNACKFSPRGESVAVRLTRNGGRLRVSVSDRGPGIPDEFRARIFQKFAQADSSDTRAKQGTGLGLSICKAIVEKLGGQIGYDSEKGRGTTFYFDLAEEKVAGPETPAHQSGRPTILVCEDDPDIAEVLLNTLDRNGYNVDLALTASQAKILVANNTYAGMTLDLALPDQDGISLVRELRESDKSRDLPIVIVSAYMEEGRRSLNGEAFGIVDWLEKPIDEAKLRGALHRAVQTSEGDKPRILHVEDDSDIFQVVRGALSETAVVVQSGSLTDARERVRSEKYDLILLDIGLPDGSGLELLPVLRGTAQSSVPVMVFSAQEVSPKTARHVEATLLKSRTSNEELVGTIKSLLNNPLFARPLSVASV